MATTVRIHRVTAFVRTRELAAKLVTQVMYEVAAGAFAKTIRGPYTTGNLALSIKREGPVHTPLGVSGRVGSDLPYARVAHDGAKVHWIFPKGSQGVVRFGSRRRPMLRFFWRRAGRVVFLPHVPGSPSKVGRSHPGQPGKKYLTEPLRDAARRHGMRYTSVDI